MRQLTSFQCEICSKIYASQEEGASCELRGEEKPILFVGDFVVRSAGFGWFDGDRDWVSNPNVPLHQTHKYNCFESCCTYAFYYVITEIDKDPEDGHRLRYHLATKAMTGKQGHRVGYDYANNGFWKLVLQPSTKLIADKMDLIGMKADYLI